MDTGIDATHPEFKGTHIAGWTDLAGGQPDPYDHDGHGTHVAALVAGALTHVAWDAFTHADGWAVHRLHWLSGHVGPLPAYEWAQYVSGLVGAALIVGWSARWFRTHPVITDPSRHDFIQPTRTPVVGYTLIAIATALGSAYGLWHGWHQPDRLRSMFYFAATRGLDTGMLVMLGIAIRTKAAGRVRHTETAEPHSGR